MYHYFGQMGINQMMRLIGLGLAMMCLFTGVSLTADSIAEEKRAGTLGLLFLTNLSPLEIVLGKLLAQGVLGFYTLFCALPVLSMSMIFGGMHFADVLMSLSSALNVLFFSAAAGLFASAICREKRRANALGTILVMFFWLGIPPLALLLKSIGAPPWLFDAIARLAVNVWGPFQIGLARLLPSTSTFWNLAWPLVLGCVFITLAAWWLRRWQDEPPAKRWRLREAWKALCYGGSAARLKLRRKLLDRSPFMWLASRDRLQVAGVWIISFAVISIIAFVLLRGSLQPVIPIGMGMALAFLVQLAFSQAVAAQLLREYEQGTLEMILSTPLSAQEVAHGQLAAAGRQYRSLCAVTFLLFWTGVVLLGSQGASLHLLEMVVLAISSGLFLLQCYVIGWLSMWSVVRAREPKKATSNGFFLITMFPAIICGAIAASVNFLALLAGKAFSPPPTLLLPAFLIVPLFFVLAFVNCIYWLRRARRELPQELHLFAFQRYTPREPITFFGKLGRFLGRLIGPRLGRAHGSFIS